MRVRAPRRPSHSPPRPSPPPRRIRSTDGQRRWYHVYVWSLCVGTTAYTLASGAHEKSNNHTCWVRADNADSLVFEAPLYAYMGLSLASLGYAALRLQCNRSSGAWRGIRRRWVIRRLWAGDGVVCCGS